MKRGLLVLAAAALPVAGTLGTIAVQERSLRNATEWRIPITGYDPRDVLRGRYVVFRYAWEVRGDAALCRTGDDCRLCLEDGGRRVLVTANDHACAAPIDPAASGISITRGLGTERGQVFAGARLWVSEARAPSLERQLRSRPMVAVTRLTSEGRLVAERLEPAR